MSDWGEIKSDWNDKVSFVEKHASSSKVNDVSESFILEKMTRFDIVKSLNFNVPKIGESLFFLTTKAISLLDVMDFIEKETGVISEACIFFYTVNDKAAKYTCDLAKRAKCKIVISDLMNSKREKERLITSIFDENNVEIVFCHNHSKIVTFRINDNYFILTGSMNAGNNARIESLQISNDKKFYDFISETYKLLKKDFWINKRY